MKILQVLPYFVPYYGGQENFVYNLSKHLTKRGNEVHVLTSNYPSTKNFEEIDNITVERHNIIMRVLRNPIAPGFLNVKSLYKKFDIVHIHNEHAFSSLVTAYYKKKYDFPLILSIHGRLDFGNYMFNLIEEIYSKTIGKEIFKLADKIVTLSPSDSNYVSLFGINTNKIHIEPNAIDPVKFASFNTSNKPDFMTKYNLEGKQVVLYLGQIIRRKGIDYLLKSIKILKMRIPENNIIFLIVGGGTFLKKAQGIASSLNIHDSVIFTGQIPFNHLIYAYKSASIFVLPSLSEGLPTSILESMFFGIPVISTDIPGVKDHFKNHAVLVPPKNEQALADAIITLLHDKKLARKLALDGKKLVETKYTWDRIAVEYESIYKEMIGERF